DGNQETGKSGETRAPFFGGGSFRSSSQDNVEMVVDDSYDPQQHATHDHHHHHHHGQHPEQQQQQQQHHQTMLAHQHQQYQPPHHHQAHQYNRQLQHPVTGPAGMVAYHAQPLPASDQQQSQEPMLDGVGAVDGTYRYHQRDSPEAGLVVGADEAMDLDRFTGWARQCDFIAPGLLDEQPNFANGSNMVMQQQPASRSPFSNEIPGVKPVAFGDEYSLMQELGRGTFSICRMCEHRTTKKHYAVKKWPTISDEVKDLLRQMLHIVPSRRPTAAQILRHPWLSRSGPRLMYNTVATQHAAGANDRIVVVDPPEVKPTNLNTEAIKGAVHATFRAISSPQAANLGPVGMSDLARRRMDKINHS
uniref:Protein kinase domain-containing protein n=1 Tax=Anopheles dirus TaxID=7168 RepID=A0A182NFM4_9DIPT